MFRYTLPLAILFVCATVAPQFAHAAAAAPAANELIKAADAIRNPQTTFSLVNTLSEFRDGIKRNETVLKIFSRPEGAAGRLRTLVRFDSPTRDRGKLMLNDGNQYWFYDPASQASIRLSPQQRLVGQASDGDVMMVNYAADYTGSLSGDERVDDVEGKKHDCWKLILTPASPAALYSKIELWLEKEGTRPFKSKFYSDSGRLLKTLYYRNYAEELGRARPTQVLIVDGIDTGLVTRLDLNDWRRRNIPDNWFEAPFLPRAGRE